ncbi:MAG TPA: SUMF1/EgtB/PvdO family nonheme iron enzyme [Niastella sp.]
MKYAFIAFFLIVNGAYTCQAQTAKSGALSKFKEPEMVSVEGGTYTMGLLKDEAREEFRVSTGTHVATVSDYFIGKYEVTQAEWKAVMGDSSNFSHHAGCGNCPVEEVSWNEIQLYILKLNDLTGKYYQLPTQAQWEFAARGGKKSKGYKYAGSDNIDEVAVTGHTQPVGSKKPNELGLYDITGNVAEWCKDGFKTGYYIRGGSWGVGAGEYQIAKDRRTGYANDPSAKVGFRLALIPYIPQPKCFQGDTLKYIKCIFDDRRAHYIDKPFYFLLNDLELPLRSFYNGNHFKATNAGEATTFSFYDVQKTNNTLADLRTYRRQNIEKIVFITIKWKTPLPPGIVENLYKTSGGELTPAVQEYFRKQVIGDIITHRFAIVGAAE